MSDFSRAFGRGFGQGFGFGMAANIFGFHPYWGMPMMGCCSFNIFSPMPMMPMMPMPFFGVNYGACCMDSFQRTTYTTQPPANTGSKVRVQKDDEEKFETEVTTPEISAEAKKLYNKWSVKSGVNTEDLTPKFCEKVLTVARNTKCEPNDLMAIIYVESRFNHSENVKKRTDDGEPEVGLIHFDKAYRNPEDDPYGITIEEINNMTAIEQLDLVEKYIQQYRKDKSVADDETLTLEQLADMICHTATEKDKNREGTAAEGEIYTTRGTKSYKRNSSFDEPAERTVENQQTKRGMKETSADHVITKGELIKGLQKVKENK